MNKPTKCPECKGELVVDRGHGCHPEVCPPCNGTGEAKPTAAEVEKKAQALESEGWPFAAALLRSLAAERDAAHQALRELVEEWKLFKRTDNYTPMGIPKNSLAAAFTRAEQVLSQEERP